MKVSTYKRVNQKRGSQHKTRLNLWIDPVLALRLRALALERKTSAAVILASLVAKECNSVGAQV